jgi:DHA2 family multidrug resistance protein-like MFS transporter
MLPLDLLRMPVIRLSGATAISSYVVQSLCYIALPFYFHDTLGLDSLAVGLLMTPWSLAVAAGTPIAGRLSDRYFAGVLGTAGLGLLTLGLLLLALLPVEPAPLDILWRMALCGFGFGFFQTPNSKAIIAHAPANRTGGASAIQSGSRMLGQSSGAALVAAVFGGLPELGPLAAVYLALAFAALATTVSSLRLGRHDVVSR